LTGLAFRQYSDAMQQELDSLEGKIGQVVQMLSRLRAENIELRQQVAAKTDEIARLAEKLTAARARVENLLKQIPETEP
jgi:cell division protein ZapB